MLIVNDRELPENTTFSPKGRYSRSNKDLSIALGRVPSSEDSNLQQPFDVQICRIPPGKARCPYHLHTAQWEFYHVVEGNGSVRHAGGLSKIRKGDAFLFRPEEPHQLINDGEADLVLYIVADNPRGDSCYYPDSGKWIVGSRAEPIVKPVPLDYFDGEE